MKGLFKTLFALFMILLVGGGAYYAYTSFKSYDPLIVTIDGAPVVNADRISLPNNKDIVIGYELGRFVSAQRCNVNVYTNSDESHDFTFSVNGISFNWSDVGEITSAFDISYAENGYVLNYPSTVAEMLGRVYPDAEISDVSTVDLAAFEYFMVVISTADGQYTRTIYCSAFIGADGITISEKELIL